MIRTINLHILFAWQQTNTGRATATTADVVTITGSVSQTPREAGLPPPESPEIRMTI